MNQQEQEAFDAAHERIHELTLAIGEGNISPELHQKLEADIAREWDAIEDLMGLEESGPVILRFPGKQE